jgi:hypothetical protein
MVLPGSYPRWPVLLVLLVGAGCTALADVKVTYRECVGMKGNTYVEKFNGTSQELADCGWKADPAPEGTRIFPGEGDLVVQASSGRHWSDRGQAALFFRQMRGDFLVITRAEAVSTSNLDHCFAHEEAAGLVVRRADAWATMLVRPYFDPRLDSAVACKDEATNPPTAEVQTRSQGFGSVEGKEKGGIGADGEAYIALCRRDDQLSYYFREQHPTVKEQAWVHLHTHPINTREPLDVGLTTSTDGRDPGMEGHFTWAAFYDYSTTPVADGCAGTLSNFELPEPE